MMKWGRKKPVSSSSSSSSSSGLSWFSKFNASSDSKPAKENKKKKKKDDDEASKNMSAKSSLSSTKPRSNSFRVLKENAVATRKSTTDMESDEKFEEIMSSVRKKVRDFQIETRGGGGGGFLNVEDKGGTLMIMTPRIRDKPRFERRDPKLLEQKPPQRSKPPTRRTGTGREDSAVLGQTVTKPDHQWQKLKETKLREVKVKADQQQRKSLYMRRELNNSKVRVFSPRATEKCRVKAIEDLKKARAREDGDRGTTTESESFAVVKCSNDPRKDFRDSMIEMIMENGINHPEELKELLVCYLRLNTDEYHDMIIKVFQQVYIDLNFHYFGVE